MNAQVMAEGARSNSTATSDTGTGDRAERLDERAHRTNFAWLLRLRWGAIAGQALTIALVDRLIQPLPLAPLLAIVGTELVSNLALTRWARDRAAMPERMLALVMAADVLLLTGLLYFTGGPSNPFNFLYLVHIALSAVVLRTRWTWTLAGLSFVCFGALFLEPGFLQPGAHDHHDHGAMRMHLYGMWVAFGVAAMFIAHFVTRVTRDLARREQELAEARALAERGERLAALATLAAGAAHELSTPLSTIAVAAKELEHQLDRSAKPTQRQADARLIREEVDRCREILGRMTAGAGPAASDAQADVTIEQLLQAALTGVRQHERIEVLLDDGLRGARLRVPPQALAQALRCVLQNAQHAVADGGEIVLQVASEADALRIEVRDSGGGMTPEVLARAGEPFFTTKEPGRGMGLGLFVSRSALERLGGKLELRSQPGRGTIAAITVPRAQPCDKMPEPTSLPRRGPVEAS